LQMLTAGIDIGSLSTEAVLLSDHKIVSYSILATGADSRRAAEKALNEALGFAGAAPEDVRFTVSTGYGRTNVPFADLQVTEITCHARGALYTFPDTRTIIDIGGQDSKVIRLDEAGSVIDFAMNDKCAAGTGRFLEVMARALEVDVDELPELAVGASRAAAVSNVCTVFAESEIVSLIGQGVPRPEIALGILESVAERVVSMVKRVGLVPKVTMSGGVAKNKGVVQALERRLGMEIRVPDEPQIVGALGAALIAESRWRKATYL